MGIDRNAREKELLKKWAESNHKNTGFSHDQNTASCFVKRGTGEKYIWEYGFESVSELRDLLEEQWEKDDNMEEILTPVLVAAIKNKPRTEIVGQEENAGQKKSDDMEKLPVYIYNF